MKGMRGVTAAAVLALCTLLIDDVHNQEKIQFLYTEYGDDMLKAAQSITKDFDYAEDAVQTVFVKLIKIVDRIDMNNNPRAFLITMAKNEAKNILKKVGRESANAYIGNTGSASDRLDIEKDAEDRDMIEYISRYIMSLSPMYTEVFVMRCLQDLSYKDISTLLEVEESTLRKRMDRLREKISNKLLKEDNFCDKQTSNTKR